MKHRKEIKLLAREALREQRGVAILLGLVLMLVLMAWMIPYTLALTVGGAGAVIFGLVSLAGMVIVFVMAINAEGEYIKLYNREEANVGALFTNLKVNFPRKLGGMMWMLLWLTIWILPASFILSISFGIGMADAVTPAGNINFANVNVTAIVIGGILYLVAMVLPYIKILSYFMHGYILASCPNVTATESLRLSKRMTQGHKGKLFVAYLSFIPWLILGFFTLNILTIVFVMPYMYITFAGFFVEIRDQAIAEGKVTRAELGME